MKKKVFTSISLSKNLKNRLEECAHMLEVDITLLLSVLCYKAGKFVCKKTRCFQTVDYQDRGQDYEIMPVWFFATDHEYMHANRLACKVSVSKLLACAMLMFLDEIMEKGINHFEIAQLRKIQNSYKKKSYFIRNFTLNTVKSVHYEQYKMQIKIKKAKKT